MKNKFLHGAAALAFCAGVVGCSEYDAGVAPETFADVKSLQYETAFVQKYGAIDPNQDWGFGSGLETRVAASEWNGTHIKPHSWESELNSIPTESEIQEYAVQINTYDNIKKDWQGNIEYTWDGKITYNIPDGDVLYVSKEFDGELNLGGPLEHSCSIYNYGNITNLTLGSANAKFTLYNAGTMVDNISSKEHDVYNIGTFKVNNNDAYAKITTLYNSGDLELGGGTYTDWQENVVQNKANIKKNVTIYSTGGIITLPGGAVWMATCHIDGIVYTEGDITFDDADDNIYICGIVSEADENGNRPDITINNDITTSYILTNNILLNGDNIFLTAGGYIKANKISTEGNGRTALGNEYEAIVVETNKTAMVDVNEFYLKNDKLGNHLGTGVYANFKSITYKEGGQETTVSAAEYTTDELFDQSRINNTEIGGTSECGGSWGNTTTTKKLIDSGRVFCEDLGSIGDFDFNDVVFDAYVYSDGSAKIVLWAAGGTLPITVAGFDPHSELGSGMVNTGVKAGDKEYFEFEKSGNYTCVNDIEVVVRQKDEAGEDQEILLKSVKGQAPQKICVPLGTRWMKEYEQINDGYTLFEDWVSGKATIEATFDQNSSTTDPSYLY